MKKWCGVSSAAGFAMILGVSPALAANIDFSGNGQHAVPCISYNISTAQQAGKPNALTRTTDPNTIRDHRAASCGATRDLVRQLNQAGGLGTPLSCDEYPFASSVEGGAGAQIMLVPAQENQRQGGLLANFYQQNNVVNGTGFTVSTSNVPANGNGITLVNHNGTVQCY